MFVEGHTSFGINNLVNLMINLMFFVVIIRDITISSMTLNVEKWGPIYRKRLTRIFLNIALSFGGNGSLEGIFGGG